MIVSSLTNGTSCIYVFRVISGNFFVITAYSPEFLPFHTYTTLKALFLFLSSVLLNSVIDLISTSIYLDFWLEKAVRIRFQTTGVIVFSSRALYWSKWSFLDILMGCFKNLPHGDLSESCKTSYYASPPSYDQQALTILTSAFVSPILEVVRLRRHFLKVDDYTFFMDVPTS